MYNNIISNLIISCFQSILHENRCNNIRSSHPNWKWTERFVWLQQKRFSYTMESIQLDWTNIEIQCSKYWQSIGTRQSVDRISTEKFHRHRDDWDNIEQMCSVFKRLHHPVARLRARTSNEEQIKVWSDGCRWRNANIDSRRWSQPHRASSLCEIHAEWGLQIWQKYRRD